MTSLQVPGDFRFSKFVIDIFLMSENMELVERRLSPTFATDNFRLSLWDLSGREVLTGFPGGLPWETVVLWTFGCCSSGRDNDDLLTKISSWSRFSSVIVSGWFFVAGELNTTRLSFSPSSGVSVVTPVTIDIVAGNVTSQGSADSNSQIDEGKISGLDF